MIFNEEIAKSQASRLWLLNWAVKRSNLSKLELSWGLRISIEKFDLMLSGDLLFSFTQETEIDSICMKFLTHEDIQGFAFPVARIATELLERKIRAKEAENIETDLQINEGSKGI